MVKRFLIPVLATYLVGCVSSSNLVGSKKYSESFKVYSGDASQCTYIPEIPILEKKSFVKNERKDSGIEKLADSLTSSLGVVIFSFL